MPKYFNRFLVVVGILLLAYSGLEAFQELVDMTFSRGPKLLYLLGASLIAAAALWQLEAKSPPNAEKVSETPAIVTPFAALNVIKPTITLEHRQSIDEWAAVMFFDIANSTDQFLDYEAELTGRANAVTADKSILNLSGIIKPKSTVRFIYGRIAPIVLKNTDSIKIPVLTAQLTYSIKYGLHDKGQLDRLSGRTLNFELMSLDPSKPVGTSTVLTTNVLFTDEVEK